MIESFSHLIVFNYKVMCTIKYIGNQFGTGRTDRGGYRSPSAGTSDLKKMIKKSEISNFCCTRLQKFKVRIFSGKKLRLRIHILIDYICIDILHKGFVVACRLFATILLFS